MNPATPGELAELVQNSDRVPVSLLGSEGLSFATMRGGIRHDVADGVVSLLAGTTLGELNAVLARDGRCLPYLPVWPEGDLTLAELVLLGLPHAGEGAFGAWRDWILGATMVTAEGTLVKGGSRVVKSVAGYDVHKLLIGSRGALVLPAELVFRTFPLSPASYPQGVQRSVDKVRSIHRVRPVDVRGAQSALGSDALVRDETTGTLWSSRSIEDFPTFPYAWSLDPFTPTLPEGLRHVYQRAKRILDPGGKLAPGAFHRL